MLNEQTCRQNDWHVTWFQVKDLARFKPMQRHLFLYDKMLLFCKKREETTDGHEKTPSYSFKHSLKVRHTCSCLCDRSFSLQFFLLLLCSASISLFSSYFGHFWAATLGDTVCLQCQCVQLVRAGLYGTLVPACVSMIFFVFYNTTAVNQW